MSSQPFNRPDEPIFVAWVACDGAAQAMVLDAVPGASCGRSAAAEHDAAQSLPADAG